MIVVVNVQISSGLDTKNNFYICNGHAKQSNLSVSSVNNTYNKIIYLHLPIYHSREYQSERKKKILQRHLPIIWLSVSFT